ncbi:MAG TPA: M23 family metallopeptidase [Solirubrobacterales bacterium]|nr:M23 family metallopeptidase [Solirubrobacterales bacterium]
MAAACLSISAGLASAARGGITAGSPPELTDAVCVATCGGMHKATTDSMVQLTGRHLSSVSKVLFKAEEGGKLKVKPSSTRRRSVTAKIPRGAATGRPKVVDPYDNKATSPTSIRVVPPDQIPDTGAFKLKDLTAKPHKAYYYGKKKPRVEYLFTNTEPTDIRIDVVNRKTDEIVASITKESQEPNVAHRARWNGRVDGSKRSVAKGSYKFRVGPASGGKLESSETADFKYLPFKFPVRGSHSYGDGVGAPRAGHTHQGQDVMASCGTPLQAARGGRVQYRAYDSGAGNYIVIDGKGTGHDYVYMHMKKPSPLNKGEKVKTGERVGAVGTTGSSTACHLHFEEWSSPGWYEGGNFMDAVTRHLKKWDSWS